MLNCPPGAAPALDAPIGLAPPSPGGQVVRILEGPPYGGVYVDGRKVSLDSHESVIMARWLARFSDG